MTTKMFIATAKLGTDSVTLGVYPTRELAEKRIADVLAAYRPSKVYRTHVTEVKATANGVDTFIFE